MSSSCVQAAVAGSRTVVGPGPSPPTITETETGGQIVRAGHKRFFLDLGSNAKGKFLRITEVRTRSLQSPDVPSCLLCVACMATFIASLVWLPDHCCMLSADHAMHCCPRMVMIEHPLSLQTCQALCCRALLAFCDSAVFL